MHQLGPLIGFFGLFALIGYIVNVVVDGSRRRQRLKLMTEFHTRLLDRIGSAREFAELLQTDGGAQFLESLSAEGPAAAGGTGVQKRILFAMQVGIVALTLGIGSLVLSVWYRSGGDAEGFVALGALTLSLGIGFLLSAALSYRVSSSLGLIDKKGPGAIGVRKDPTELS